MITILSFKKRISETDLFSVIEISLNLLKKFHYLVDFFFPLKITRAQVSSNIIVF